MVESIKTCFYRLFCPSKKQSIVLINHDDDLLMACIKSVSDTMS